MFFFSIYVWFALDEAAAKTVHFLKFQIFFYNRVNFSMYFCWTGLFCSWLWRSDSGCDFLIFLGGKCLTQNLQTVKEKHTHLSYPTARSLPLKYVWVSESQHIYNGTHLVIIDSWIYWFSNYFWIQCWHLYACLLQRLCCCLVSIYCYRPIFQLVFCLWF